MFSWAPIITNPLIHPIKALGDAAVSDGAFQVESKSWGYPIYIWFLNGEYHLVMTNIAMEN